MGRAQSRDEKRKATRDRGRAENAYRYTRVSKTFLPTITRKLVQSLRIQSYRAYINGEELGQTLHFRSDKYRVIVVSDVFREPLYSDDGRYCIVHTAGTNKIFVF